MEQILVLLPPGGGLGRGLEEFWNNSEGEAGFRFCLKGYIEPAAFLGKYLGSVLSLAASCCGHCDSSIKYPWYKQPHVSCLMPSFHERKIKWDG